MWRAYVGDRGSGRETALIGAPAPRRPSSACPVLCWAIYGKGRRTPRARWSQTGHKPNVTSQYDPALNLGKACQIDGLPNCLVLLRTVEYSRIRISRPSRSTTPAPLRNSMGKNLLWSATLVDRERLFTAVLRSLSTCSARVPASQLSRLRPARCFHRGRRPVTGWP